MEPETIGPAKQSFSSQRGERCKEEMSSQKKGQLTCSGWENSSNILAPLCFVHVSEEPGQDLTDASLIVPAAHRLVTWSYTPKSFSRLNLCHTFTLDHLPKYVYHLPISCFRQDTEFSFSWQ